MKQSSKLVVVASLAFSLLRVQAQEPETSQRTQARIVIDADRGDVKISRHIFGHFAEHLGRCIYGGFWIQDENGRWKYNEAVIEALQRIRIPNLRWPGGCFADYYHWRDGIGPREERPKMVNTVWGGVIEDNSFGTHEFLELVERLGAEPFIVGNVGSGTVREMAEWWEYVNHPGGSSLADLRKQNGREQPWGVRIWGIGNESWGCGGRMRPEYYVDLFRRFAEFLRPMGGTRPFLVAVGPNAAGYDWTEVLMRDARWGMDALDLHYYTFTGTWDNKGRATEFTEAEWFELMQKALRMEELIRRHSTIMDRYDPDKRVALLVGEWGNWHQVEPGTNPGFLYQQNALRDALSAALNFDIFIKHADRVRMANIAQTVNVLQAMVLTEGERIVLTPTYYTFELYTVHHDATRLPLTVEAEPYRFGDDAIPALSASASRDDQGKIHITMTNIDPNRGRTVEVELRGAEVAQVRGRILTAPTMQAHNTFDVPGAVRPAEFTGARLENGVLQVDLPAKSLVALELE